MDSRLASLVIQQSRRVEDTLLPATSIASFNDIVDGDAPSSRYSILFDVVTSA